MNPDQRIDDEALRWATLTGDPEFADWEGFTAWLEQDAAHAAAYDAVQFALDDAAGVLAAGEPVPLGANDDEPAARPGQRWAWFGTAVAAALVMVATFTLWPALGGDQVYVTAAGESRHIALADGSTIDLGGGSRLTVVEGDAREARLEAGEALFTIRHDAADPFVLTVGEERLVDAGTVFDVRIKPDGLDLAVAEGAVIVNPEGLGLRVDAGQRAMGSGGRYRVSAVDPGEVGEWSRGRITFRDASTAEIAAELTRATGTAFAVASGDGEVRLSGSIALDAVKADPRALGPILGLSVQQAGDRWMIAAE